MVFQRGAAAESDAFGVVPPAVAEAASRYQRFRVIEKEHLERMGRHNLLVEWSAEVRASVLDARERIREVRAAREVFRQQVREFVCALRVAREPLPGVIRHTRSMLQLLESSGAIENDNGWLEAEVLEWAIEEFDNVA